MPEALYVTRGHYSNDDIRHRVFGQPVASSATFDRLGHGGDLDDTS